MKNDAHLLPARLRAAATAIANARAGRRGIPAVTNVLEILPQTLLDEVVADAAAALDATVHPAVEPAQMINDHAKRRIALAAAAGADLHSQAVVLLDVADDGAVTVSTFARQPGTPAKAIGEWANGLWRHAISVVPFRTVFGWGCDGVPVPLSEEERSTLTPTQLAYVDRNTSGSDV